MGGCCCCFPRGSESPGATEENVPLSHQRPSSVASAEATELFTLNNHETSEPDVYRPPPAPLPFHVTLDRPQTPQRTQDHIWKNKGDGFLGARNVGPHQGDMMFQDSDGCVMKENDKKAEINTDNESGKDLESDFSKAGHPLPYEVEEDGCPICLEEYDAENPELLTKCGHHYHLACILEWMERSEDCPVCGKELIFDPPID